MDYSFAHPLVPPEAVASWLDLLPQPIAVTGGTGFLGSHLVETLCAAGIKPRVLARDPVSPRWIAPAPVSWVEGSLTEPDGLLRLVEGAGTVLHLAGVVRAGSAAEFDRGNRIGTANLVQAVGAVAPSARFVYVSSLAAAGPSDDPTGIGPEAEPAPISHYGRSKLAAEESVRTLGEDNAWSIVRPPAIYGPRDTDVFEFFRMVNRGLVALPAGERWLTVAWVGDVVRSILAAGATEDSGAVYHLGGPAPMRLEELIRVLAEAGGLSARLLRVPAGLVAGAGLVGSILQRCGWRSLALTRDKTRELLARHWTARTEDSLVALGVSEGTVFADGCRETWAWYRDQGWLNSKFSILNSQ